MANKDFSNKLKNLRLKAGYTQKEVYEHFKIPQSTFSSWEVGKSEPSGEMLIKLCEFYKCDMVKEFSSDGDLSYKEWNIIEKYRSLDNFGKEHIDYELDREVTKVKELNNIKERIQELENEPEAASDPMRAIPYYQRLASAGTGQIVFDGVPVDKIDIPDIPKYKKVSYAIEVNGNSMKPLYHNGDVLLVEPTCKVDVGEIGIFIIGDESYVKKLGEGKLISLNAGYGDIELTEYSKCMGRVIDKISKYPELSAEDMAALHEGLMLARSNKRKA